MEKNKTIPFPQADSVEKIIRIVNVTNPDLMKNQNKLKVILGDVTDRQISYYLSACMYLDILNNDRAYTEFGQILRNSNSTQQKIYLASKIISKEVFAEVYFTELFLNVKLELSDVVNILKKYVNFQSEAIYKRRSQTVMKWVEWIKRNCE